MSWEGRLGTARILAHAVSSSSPPPATYHFSPAHTPWIKAWWGKQGTPKLTNHTHLWRFNSNDTFVFPPSFLPNAVNNQGFYVPDNLGLVCFLSGTKAFLKARALSQPSASAEMEVDVALMNVCWTNRLTRNVAGEATSKGFRYPSDLRTSFPAQAPQAPRWRQETSSPAQTCSFHWGLQVDIPSSSRGCGGSPREKYGVALPHPVASCKVVPPIPNSCPDLFLTLYWDLIHIFKVFNSVVFSLVTELGNHHHNQL